MARSYAELATIDHCSFLARTSDSKTESKGNLELPQLFVSLLESTFERFGWRGPARFLTRAFFQVPEEVTTRLKRAGISARKKKW